MEEYNKYIEKKEEKETEPEILKLPKLVQRKIKKIIECLSDNGVDVDANGTVTDASEYFSSGESILSHLIYGIRGGKDKPSDWTNFLSLLTNCKIPKDTLCQKAINDLKRAKKNAKTSSD